MVVYSIHLEFRSSPSGNQSCLYFKAQRQFRRQINGNIERVLLKKSVILVLGNILGMKKNHLKMGLLYN